MLRNTRERAKIRDPNPAKKLDYYIKLSFIRGAIFIGLSFLAAILFDYSLLAIVSFVIGFVWSLITSIWYFKHKSTEIDNTNELFESPVQPKSGLELRQAQKAQEILEAKRLRHGEELFLTPDFYDDQQSDIAFELVSNPSIITSSISAQDTLQYEKKAKKKLHGKKSKKSKLKKDNK